MAMAMATATATARTSTKWLSTTTWRIRVMNTYCLFIHRQGGGVRGRGSEREAGMGRDEQSVAE